MKKTLAVVAVSAALAVAAVPGSAAPKKRSARVERARYNFTEGTIGADGARGHMWIGGARFEVRPGDRTVGVVITDQTGLPVPGMVMQDVDGDHMADVEHRFCGATEAPVAVRAKTEVIVEVAAGTCGDRPVSTGTTGTIEATFRATAR